MNDGTVHPASGIVARVSNSFTEFNANGICSVEYGEVEGLPEPDTTLIVSQMVLAVAKNRNDLVAPATGHPQCIRENGRIVSVPGFVH